MRKAAYSTPQVHTWVPGRRWKSHTDRRNELRGVIAELVKALEQVRRDPASAWNFEGLLARARAEARHFLEVRHG